MGLFCGKSRDRRERSRFPFSPPMSSASRHFEIVKEINLPRALVWQVLSQTDRLNRHIGLSPVQYDGLTSDSSGFYRAARGSVAGIALSWREYPFQWENQERYSVVRIYDKGPIDRFEGGLRLEDSGTGKTTLNLFSDISGRGVAGRALVPLIARQFMQKTIRFCENNLVPDAILPARGPAPGRAHVDENLLARLIIQLKERPVQASYADALAHHLRTAGDDETAALRPFEWARGAGLDDHEALRTCLHGVKAGILNMRWAMMCPNCRVSKAESSTLSAVEGQVHCDLCGVGYDLNFDRYVELKFAVHPAVRRAEGAVFCIGGPFQSPHVLMQKRIEAGETTLFPLLSARQTLRLRILKHNKSVEVTPDAPSQSRLVWNGKQWSVPNARGPFSVENCSDQTIFVALEKTEWDDSAVTAARVTMLQEFRDLFSSEVLSPGRQVAVENVTLFFSDLSNSTALYESIGDAPAFGRVGKHFDFLTEHIAANRGAVVKTMGDAVMAVFYAPDDAVRAALQIQQQFHEFRDTLSDGGSVDLKIGLHHGPALVINSNDRLDYFGRTVNIAARVAASSRRGDFVLTGQLWEYSEVQRILIESRANLSRFEANLRGVEQTFALVRVRP